MNAGGLQGSRSIETPDFTRAAERVVASMRRLLRVRRSILLRADDTSQTLECIATAGDPDGREWLGRTLQIGEGAGGRAVADGRWVWSQDPLNDPQFTIPAWLSERIREERLGSVLGVPLIAGGRTLGAFVLADGPGRIFTEDELQLASAFADEAALALENIRLYERAESRAEKLAALSALTRLVTSAQHGQRVFEAVAQAAIVLLGGLWARVWVDDPTDRMLRPGATFGTDPRLDELATDVPVIPYGQGVVGQIVESRAPRYILDLERDPRWLNRRLITEGGVRAFAGLPLITGERFVGVLVVLFGERREFTAEEKELMGLLADHAAIAIGNVEMFVREQAARADAEASGRRFETLARIARTVTSSLEPQTVLDSVAVAATDLLPDSASRIWVLEGDRLVLRAEAKTHGPPRSGRKRALALGEGLTGGVAATRQPLLVEDALTDPRTVDVEWMRQGGFVTYIGLPLLVRDRLVGVLSLLARRRHPFSQDEIDALTSFGAQAAIAIENARLYDELVAALKQAQTSQQELVRTERLRALGEMAAGVAHDFNNLLAVIVGRCELLLRRVQAPYVRRALQSIGAAARDGTETVRRILEFTRTGDARPLQPVGLGELLQEVVELNRPRWKDDAQARGVIYQIEIEPATVPAIAGHPEELREVFANLLVNALDAMPAGGRVSVRFALDDGWLVVKVEDTGCGMSEETRRRAFDPFFTTKGQRGTGLGLAVVWGIVQRHGGRVKVASELGRGSTFTLRFPVAREGLTQGAEPASEVPRELAGRILVIDDEPEVLEILAEILRERGCTVVEAAGGEEGLVKCETGQFDLVLTDLSMPGMSGWEVVDACRQRFPGLPVGLVTGWGERLEVKTLERSRVDFVLSKPFTADDVIGHVAAILQRRLTEGKENA